MRHCSQKNNKTVNRNNLFKKKKVVLCRGKQRKPCFLQPFVTVEFFAVSEGRSSLLSAASLCLCSEQDFLVKLKEHWQSNGGKKIHAFDAGL